MSLMVATTLGAAQLAPGDPLTCPTADEARQALASNAWAEIATFNEGPGTRVQRQHPTTAMFAMLKFIDQSGGFWNCQYANHVGIVASLHTLGARIEADQICEDGSACVEGPFWRLEWLESTPAQDRPGMEQLYVCVEPVDGQMVPSLGCSATVTGE